MTHRFQEAVALLRSEADRLGKSEETIELIFSRELDAVADFLAAQPARGEARQNRYMSKPVDTEHWAETGCIRYTDGEGCECVPPDGAVMIAPQPDPEQAARELRSGLEWREFSLEEFPEGNTAIFQWLDGNGYPGFFVDRITWDSESPSQWDDGGNGLDFDDVTHYALFSPAERAGKGGGR